MRRRRGEKIWIFFLDAHKNKAQQTELNLKQLVTQFKVRLRDEDLQEYNMQLHIK